jgi:Pvc16 N-terminal domain/IPT/TIG domain
MSDYLAIGGVSAVLRWQLANALTAGGPSSIIGVSSPVTALSPDLVPTGADEQPQINLFMYYASLNASFRNNALPSQDSQGRRLSNPPLALDLHYLVSAYGKNEFDPEILLAWAMQVFYETPVLSRELIQSSITGIINAGHMSSELQLIVTTNLASQVESIRIAPESLSNEEINKLWMAFNAHYRPTTSYQVSVVLIEETQSFKSNLPVQSRNVLTLPWQSPIIDNITPQPIGSGEMLTITGRNFIGDSPADTLISFDQQPPIAPDTIQPGCIRIRIPSTLQAGVRTLQIVRNVRFGTSTDPHPGFFSSATPFLLAPTITNASPITAATGTTFTLSVTPAVGSSQEVVLLMGDTAIPIPSRPVSGPSSSSTLDFPIPTGLTHPTPPAGLPLRLQIDRSQSRLTLDTTTGSPTFGQYLPQVEVTGP